MAFTRGGGDVKETLGIGRDGILKIIGGIIVNKEDSIFKFSPETNVVIVVSKGRFKIIKNRFGPDGGEGPETELVKTLLKLLEEYQIWDSSDRIRIFSNGNVGIGTTTPSTKLYVRKK